MDTAVRKGVVDLSLYNIGKPKHKKGVSSASILKKSQLQQIICFYIELSRHNKRSSMVKSNYLEGVDFCPHRSL